MREGHKPNDAGERNGSSHRKCFRVVLQDSIPAQDLSFIMNDTKNQLTDLCGN